MLCVCIFHSFFVGCFFVIGVDIFTQTPRNTSAPVGSIAQFTCTVEGADAVTYLVNNMTLADVASIGVSVSLSAPVSNGNQINVSLYVPAINNTTGWQVVCTALLLNGTRVFSSPAYLQVLGMC